MQKVQIISNYGLSKNIKKIVSQFSPLSPTVASSDNILLRPFLVLSGWDHCNASFVFDGDCLKQFKTTTHNTNEQNWRLQHSILTRFALIQSGHTNWQSYTSASIAIIQSYPTMTNEVNTQGLNVTSCLDNQSTYHLIG